MLLSLILFALQEPAPTPEAPAPEPLPQGPSQQDPVSTEEIMAKLGQVTESFSEADRLLNRTIEDLTEAAPTATPEAGQSLLDQAADTSLRLVGEMEELLALLPEPPPSSGSGNGQNQSQPNQGQDPGQMKNPEEQELADGNKQGSRPDSSRPQEGQGQAQSILDSPLRDFLRDPRDGQWGKLPPRLQQAIDNASAGEVPLRYRRWLVEYHRQDVRPADD